MYFSGNFFLVKAGSKLLSMLHDSAGFILCGLNTDSVHSELEFTRSPSSSEVLSYKYKTTPNGNLKRFLNINLSGFAERIFQHLAFSPVSVQ